MTGTSSQWADWVGRRQRVDDVLDLNRAHALQATLDDPQAPLAAG